MKAWNVVDCHYKLRFLGKQQKQRPIKLQQITVLNRLPILLPYLLLDSLQKPGTNVTFRMLQVFRELFVKSVQGAVSAQPC